jgi:hypothetical protein
MTAPLLVFVHGCFWHGCPKHYRRPQSRTDYWDAKLLGNKLRDRRVAARLRRAGWSVIVVWECDVEKDTEAQAARIERTAERLAGRPYPARRCVAPPKPPSRSVRRKPRKGGSTPASADVPPSTKLASRSPSSGSA